MVTMQKIMDVTSSFQCAFGGGADRADKVCYPSVHCQFITKSARVYQTAFSEGGIKGALQLCTEADENTGI